MIAKTKSCESIDCKQYLNTIKKKRNCIYIHAYENLLEKWSLKNIAQQIIKKKSCESID